MQDRAGEVQWRAFCQTGVSQVSHLHAGGTAKEKCSSRGIERGIDSLSGPCADAVCNAHGSAAGEEGILAACVRFCGMRDVHPSCTAKTRQAVRTPLVGLVQM